jgi:hypothetical protein
MALWVGCAPPGTAAAPSSPSSVLAIARQLSAPVEGWRAALGGSRWALAPEGLEGPGARGVDDRSGSSRSGPRASSSPLYARLSRSAAPLWVGAGSALPARLPVRLEGLSAVDYEVVDGVALAPLALPETDVLVAVDGARLEVFYRLRSADAEAAWTWTLGDSPLYALSEEGGAVLLSDAAGQAQLRISAPGAIDRAGTRYAVSVQLEGRTVRFALAVPEGARVAYPLLVDPTSRS